MGFKKGLFIVALTFVSISLFALAGNFYFFKMIGTNVLNLSQSAIKAKDLTRSIVACNSSVVRHARNHLIQLDETSYKTLLERIEKCRNEVGQNYKNQARLQRWKELLDRIVTTTTELGARKKSIKLSIANSTRQIENSVRSPALKVRASEIHSKLLKLQSEINSAFIDQRQVDASVITSLQKSIAQLIEKNIRPLSESEAEGFHDILVDITSAAAVWNAFVKQEDAQFVPVQSEFGEEGANLLSSELQDISTSGEKGVSYLRAMALFIFMITFGAVGIFIFISRLTLKSWMFSINRFKDVCTRILENDYSVIDQINNSQKHSGSQAKNLSRYKTEDEFEIAFQAISQMLTELASMKKGLEEKVEERTRALKETQDQLIQSEKLAGLGTMAAGVAHELNNPLQVIMGMTERVMAQENIDVKEKKLLEKVLNSSHRMNKIIEQLKRLARKSQENDRVWTPLSTLLENSVTLVKLRMQNERVKYSENISTSYVLDCSPTQLESVFSNLYVNSLDAIQGTGVRQEYFATEVGSKDVVQKSSQNAQNEIMVVTELDKLGNLLVKVSDTGPGIPESLRKKIFEPFFTTKDTNKGTGLGLALCNQIITQHLGTIEIICPSEQFAGKGTTFVIKFPAAMVKIIGESEKRDAA